MMDRRTFLGTLTGGLLVAPVGAGAQQPAKAPQIGYIGLGTPTNPESVRIRCSISFRCGPQPAERHRPWCRWPTSSSGLGDGKAQRELLGRRLALERQGESFVVVVVLPRGQRCHSGLEIDESMPAGSKTLPGPCSSRYAGA